FRCCLLSSLFFSLFFLLRPPPPSSTLFPYTTLFRSFRSQPLFVCPMPLPGFPSSRLNALYKRVVECHSKNRTSSCLPASRIVLCRSRRFLDIARPFFLPSFLNLRRPAP